MGGEIWPIDLSRRKIIKKGKLSGEGGGKRLQERDDCHKPGGKTEDALRAGVEEKELMGGETEGGRRGNPLTNSTEVAAPTVPWIAVGVERGLERRGRPSAFVFKPL